MSLQDVLEGRARWELLTGDSMQVLPYLPAESIDALVTDPPAGIGFMGKEWDSSKGGRARWVMWLGSVMLQAFRAMKPGAHGLVWALPRTSHWTATALEDAGFEVRDRVSHLFGTGFPKSSDVSKALDKRAGAKRGEPELLDYVGREGWNSVGGTHRDNMTVAGTPAKQHLKRHVTAPATDAAKLWDGWGTALKPAMEDWWLVRKPLEGTVAANVAKWGTGGLNVDGCRIEGAPRTTHADGSRTTGKGMWTGEGGGLKAAECVVPSGRWPAHLVLDEEAAAMLDAQSGTLRTHGNRAGIVKSARENLAKGRERARVMDEIRPDSGDASRFFYVAKTSTAERNRGCEALPGHTRAESTGRKEGSAGSKSARAGAGSIGARNHHPTVKPLALMRWLCRLITPPGGVVLDPFTGSGSTGCAALQEGFRFIGIEREEAYARIARARLEEAVRPPAQPELFATT